MLDAFAAGATSRGEVMSWGLSATEYGRARLRLDELVQGHLPHHVTAGHVTSNASARAPRHSMRRELPAVRQA
jgi:hypothetical protein